MEPIIPTIDISPYTENTSSPAAAGVVRAVREACTDKGFFQITGNGISPQMQQEAFKAAKAFFALPMAEKTKIDRATVRGACGRGYECFKSQIQTKGGNGDNKEVSQIGDGTICVRNADEILEEQEPGNLTHKGVQLSTW